MNIIRIPSITDVDNAAKEFLRLCKNHFFFAFYGELGAGKTTCIKALCRALGSKDTIASPSFSIVNEYQIPPAASGKPGIIYHMDFFRLKSLEEALDIGTDEYFKKENAYCFVEWPELVESLLPENTVKVRLERNPDDSRTIKVEI